MLLNTLGTMPSLGTFLHIYRTGSTTSLTQTSPILPHGCGCAKVISRNPWNDQKHLPCTTLRDLDSVPWWITSFQKDQGISASGAATAFHCTHRCLMAMPMWHCCYSGTA